jgi:hypothetical protein
MDKRRTFWLRRNMMMSWNSNKTSNNQTQAFMHSGRRRDTERKMGIEKGGKKDPIEVPEGKGPCFRQILGLCEQVVLLSKRWV